MKFIQPFLLSLASYERVSGAGVPACKAVPASCGNPDPNMAATCSAYLSANKISRPTCSTAKGKATVTSVVQTTTTSTELVKATTTTSFISSTVTVKGPTITLPAPTSTTVTTKVVIATKTFTAVSILSSTTFTTEEVTTTLSESTVTYVSSTSTWAQETCSNTENARRGLRRGTRDIAGRGTLKDLDERAAGPIIPPACSCFLTSIQFPKTQTVSLTQTIKKFTTKIIGGSVPTLTNTIFVTKTTTATSTASPKSTVTQTSTKMSTSTTVKITMSISTKLVTQISQITTTTTSTSTEVLPIVVNENPCGAGQHGRDEIDIPHATKLGADVVALDGAEDVYTGCCNVCYSGQGCVFWSVNSKVGSCTIFVSLVETGCTTPQCNKGFPELLLYDNDAKVKYFTGPCGSNQIHR